MDDVKAIPFWDTFPAMAASHQGEMVYFGECAGMFHPGPADEGILILPPFGREALACAKTLRLLAESLSRQGYPVLRLDFPGTGDAPGDESGLDVLASRSAAAAEAGRWMRERAGLRCVSVIGVRLGAAIALLAAGELAARRLLLCAPVLNGRAFLRELQQMQCFYSPGGGCADTAAPNEFNGFQLSQSSVASLGALDLRKAAFPAGACVALMCPAETGAGAALARHWAGSGVDAAGIDYGNTQALLSDPATTPPEDELIGKACDWFGAFDGHVGLFRRPSGCAELAREIYTERACRFGPGNAVFGILCEPVRPNPAAPALAIVNTGGNPHSGWGRQTVELARELAAHGVATLRLDAGGVGETPDVPERGPRVVYVARSSEDILAALRFLETAGYRKPAIAGICSGAFLTFQALRRGADVSGALMINLQKFYWREGDRLVLYNSMGTYARRLFDRNSLKRLLGGESDIRGVALAVGKRLLQLAAARLSKFRLFGKAARRQGAHVPPPREVLAAARARGATIMMAYTRGDGGIDEMRAHVGSGSRRGGEAGDFTSSVIRGADHNFSTAASRKCLFPVVLDFVETLAAKRKAENVVTKEYAGLALA